MSPISLLGYMLVYLIMYPAGLAVMARMVRQGPVKRRRRGEDRGRTASSAGLAGAVSRSDHAQVCSISCQSGHSSWRLAVFLYVLLDGFDLGVGMLYGLAPDAADRGTVMNAIAPVWDGNETWLVLGGVGLLSVFPLAFAIIIPAVYFPILLMLLALVFRGVAFEFRFGTSGPAVSGPMDFASGRAIATFAQGTVLGAFIQGFRSRA